MNRADLLSLCEEYTAYLRDCEVVYKAWESRYFYPLIAYIHLLKQVEPNKEMLEICTKILNDNSAWYSPFRSDSRQISLAMLCTSADPAVLMLNARDFYNKLYSRVPSGSYLSALSLMAAERIPPSEFDQVADETTYCYEHMTEDHFWLTGREDVIFAGFLAMEKKDWQLILTDAEKCFARLRPEFRFSGNVLQLISQNLALCPGTNEQRCLNFLQLVDLLKNRGVKVKKSYELGGMALLANVSLDLNEVADSITFVLDYLDRQHGYGILSSYRTFRLMHAVMITALYHMNASLEMMGAMIVSVLVQIQQERAAAAAAAA